MDFKDNKPIYRQIIDYCFGRILSGTWTPDQKIPSVRELALQMSVNTHTVLKAFEFLQVHGIIYPRRGMGFFLAADAPESVNATRREEFFEDTLVELFAEMRMLGIGIDDVVARWNDTTKDRR